MDISQSHLEPLMNTTFFSPSFEAGWSFIKEEKLDNPTPFPTVLQPTVLRPTVLEPSILQRNVLRPTVLEPSILQPNVLRPTVLHPTIPPPTFINSIVEADPRSFSSVIRFPKSSTLEPVIYPGPATAAGIKRVHLGRT